MAQAAVDAVEKTDEAAKDSEKDEKQGTSTSLECAVCLQPCIHPAKLPCTHIFCYLCVKGVANQSKKCPMCRQEIPADFIERPQLVDVEDNKVPGADEEYQWFYEGRNGWWQYDPRTSLELETAYKQGKRTCELLIAGFLYIADFGSMLQLRRNDPSRHRRIKRDHHNIPKKGIAGLRLNRMEEEAVTREIRGAERPASPASDTMGTGDGTNTPVPPSNTPQTPAGNASGDATPLIDRNDAARQDSLHQVLEQMRSLMIRGHFPHNSDNNDVDDTNHDAANFSDNTRSLLWIQTTNLDAYEEQDESDRH